MKTTFSETLEKLRRDLKQSQSDIAKLLDPDTHGYNEYKELFITDLHHAAMKLKEVSTLTGS